MGYDLLKEPLVQLYLFIVGVSLITVIWDRLRNPPAPEDHASADRGRLRRAAEVRAELPDAVEWARRQSPQADGGNKNHPGRC
jgi:hypothetical protein